MPVARFPWLHPCKDRTIYYWDGMAFQPAARFTHSLIKLVPTEWGAPTFEIDGIKMLPTAKISPYTDAERKVGWIQPRGKVVLDTCGGLGVFRRLVPGGGLPRRCCLLRRIPTWSGYVVSIHGHRNRAARCT